MRIRHHSSRILRSYPRKIELSTELYTIEQLPRVEIHFTIKKLYPRGEWDFLFLTKNNMAQRRMFSKVITSSSRFLMMPPTTRELYFQLGMNADDDGFVEHFTIMRMVEAKPDDLRLLAAREFVKVFDDKVLIITDWKENNYIQSDRYKASKYLQTYRKELAEISQEREKEDGGIQNVYKLDTQVRLGKDRKGEEREEKSSPAKPETSVSWLGHFNEKEEFVCGIPSDTLKAFAAKYKANEAQIVGKAEDLVVWCKTNGRVKKNYKLFLQNILKREFGIWTPADKELQDRIARTRAIGTQSSPFARELSKKMKM